MAKVIIRVAEEATAAVYISADDLPVGAEAFGMSVQVDQVCAVEDNGRHILISSGSANVAKVWLEKAGGILTGH